MSISSPLLRIVCEVLQACSKNWSDRAAYFSFHRTSIWRRLRRSHLRGGLTVHLTLTLCRLPSLAKGASLRTTFWPRFWTAWPSPALSRREVHLTEPVISLMRYSTVRRTTWSGLLMSRYSSCQMNICAARAWLSMRLAIDCNILLLFFFVYGLLAGGLRCWQF